ncbi:MAG: SecDF P1 head subdomain-containing protein [Planctomycetota bacterium]|jgi:chromate transport protein ChrA
MKNADPGSEPPPAAPPPLPPSPSRDRDPTLGRWAATGGVLLIVGALAPWVYVVDGRLEGYGFWQWIRDQVNAKEHLDVFVHFVAHLVVGVLAVVFSGIFRARARGIALTSTALGLLVLTLLPFALERGDSAFSSVTRLFDVQIVGADHAGVLLASLGLISILTGLALGAREEAGCASRWLLSLGGVGVIAAVVLPLDHRRDAVVEHLFESTPFGTTWPHGVTVVLLLLLAVASVVAAIAASRGRGPLHAGRVLAWITAVAWPILAIVMITANETSRAGGASSFGPALVAAVATTVHIIATPYGFLMILVAGLVGWIRGGARTTEGETVILGGRERKRDRHPELWIAGLAVLAFLTWFLFLRDRGPTVAVRIALDVDSARSAGHLRPDVPDDAILQQTLILLSDRVEELDGELEDWHTEPKVPARPYTVVMNVRGIEPDRHRVLRRALESSGDLQFLIEVRPKERYAVEPEDPTPPRLQQPPYPWDGTAEAFDAYKEAEVERWRGAQAANEEYVPSRPDLLVLPRKDSSAEGVDAFHVLEAPASHLRFDGSIVERGMVSRSHYDQRPVVLFEVRTLYQNVFGDWTEQNVGMPMAIVLEGEYVSAPIIRDRLTDSVQITLGQGSYGDLQAEAEALVAALQSGRIKVPVRVLSITPEE